jgi:hypothetical protein
MADNWIVIELNGDDHHYRVAMAWKGGYTTGDSWRINSGITSCTETDTDVTFNGSSGSKYVCSKARYGMDSQLAGVVDTMLTKKMPVRVLPEDTDWSSMDWLIS